MRKAMQRSIAFIAATLVASPALAAQAGSLPAFPPGLTLGMAAGFLPAEPGVYWTEKNFYASADPVDDRGHRTGAHLHSYASVAILQFVPGWKLFGADYAFQLDSYGLFSATLDFPSAAHRPSYRAIGMSDLAIRPLMLSWHLSPRLALALREGIYVPIGSYDAARPLSISHHRYTFEQGVALSYAGERWTLSANAIVDVNGSNHATVIDGRPLSYRSGSTYNVDMTALRSMGRWQFGPVGYAYHQFTPDHGPAALNGGIPTEVGAGMLLGYQFAHAFVHLYEVHDIAARNVGRQNRLWLSFGMKLF